MRLGKYCACGAETVTGAEPPEGEENTNFIIRTVKYLKEVVVAKDPPVVHVFDVVEHGRRFYRTLAFSSDASLSLVSRPPSGVSSRRRNELICAFFVCAHSRFEESKADA